MSLPNDFKILEWVANQGLAFLLASMPWIKCATTEYQPQFDNSEYAKGDTIQIREANRRIGGEGSTVNIDGIIEKTDTLTIEKQFNDAMDFTSKQKMLYMQGESGKAIYAERYIKPSILSIVSRINAYIADKAEEDLVYTAGSASAPINSFGVLADVRAMMADLHMPIDQYQNYLVVSPFDDAALKKSIPTLFLPKTNEMVFNKYFLSSIANFEYQDTAIIKNHISGAASSTLAYPVGTLTVKTTVSSGNTITVSGFGGVKIGVFVKGDVIRVSGSNIVVPNPYTVTGQIATFVVTDTSVDSDINGDAVVHVKKEIITDVNNPFRNLDAPLFADAVVTCEPSHRVNAAFVKRGLSYAAPKAPATIDGQSATVTDTEFGTGISLRVAKDYDIVNDKNIMRFDVFCGARFWSDYGVRVMSQI